MEKEGIPWKTWNFKDDLKTASDASLGDKFILWRSGVMDGFEGVVGQGYVCRECKREISPPMYMPITRTRLTRIRETSDIGG